MPITLNQIIAKVQTICLGHKQIRSFYQVMLQDWLTDKTVVYPSVLLMDNGGTVSTKGHSITAVYRLFIVDLVNVDDHTKSNINDVQSDMLSVAVDLISQLNRDSNGWVLSSDNSFTLLEEDNDDQFGGVVVDFSIRFQYPQNICEVPTIITGL